MIETLQVLPIDIQVDDMVKLDCGYGPRSDERWCKVLTAPIAYKGLFDSNEVLLRVAIDCDETMNTSYAPDKTIEVQRPVKRVYKKRNPSMRALFDCFAIYDWQPQLGHFSLISLVNANHTCGESLKNAVSSILSIGVSSGEEPKVWYFAKGDSINPTLDK
jgi:hypothetical protein